VTSAQSFEWSNLYGSLPSTRTVSSMTGTPPTTQRAWVLRRTGKPREVLELEEDYPIPVPRKSQILIRVHATALNREHAML